MTSSALLILLLVSTCNACGDSHWKGLLWNRFNNSGDPGYILGTVDAATEGDDEALIVNGVTYTVFDQGVVFVGNFTGMPIPRPASASDPAESYFATVWTNIGLGANMEMEIKTFLRTDEFDDAGVLIGPNICYFETVEDRLVPYAGSVTVDEMLLVTWKHDDGTITIYSQLIIAITSTASNYALMNFRSDWDLDAIDNGAIIAHVRETTGAFATVCSDTKAANLTTMSNNYCGHVGLVVFSLINLCTDVTICANLDNLVPDLEKRNYNCRELLKPADNCYVTGTCTRVDANSFQFSFIFLKTIAKFGNFELVDSSHTFLSDSCTLSVTDAGDFYTIEVNIDPGIVSDCGIEENAGEYTLFIHNYNDSMIYQQGSKIYEIMCNPDDLVANLTQSVTVGDIAATSFSPATGDTLDLAWGNMADTNHVDFDTFQAGDKVLVGTPLYPVVSFTPGPYARNTYPYGVYVTSCVIGNTDAFDDKTYNVVTDRCPVTGIPAFEFATGFKVFDPATITYGGTHTIVAGPIRAARWTTGESIWLQCVVDFCTMTGFDGSYCINSCDGTGVNDVGNRRKRQEASDTSVVLTAHLKVIDRVDAVSSLSCANETMAYTTIAALLILLLIASAITALLFLKLRSRRMK